MDYALIGVGGSNDGGTQNSGNRQRSYTHLSSSNSFIEYHHPENAQRRQLAAEVGLDQKQAGLWFQNKRIQLQTQFARAGNSALRVENERIQKENPMYNEALKKIICAFYGSPSFPQKEHGLLMQKMRLENAQLRDQCQKVYSFLQSSMSQQELQHGLNPIVGSSHDPTLASLLNQEAYGSGIGSSSLMSRQELQHGLNPIVGSSHDPTLASLLNQEAYGSGIGSSSLMSQQELQHGLNPIVGSSHDPTLASLLNQEAYGSGIGSSSLMSQQELQHGLNPIVGSSHDPTLASLLNQEAYGSGIGSSSLMSQQELQHGLNPIVGSSHDPTLANLLNQEAYGSGIGSSSLGLTSIIGGGGTSFQNNSMEESIGFQNQKILMKEIARTAREELARLLHYNEPFWVLSSSQEGKLTLHLGNYEVCFPKNNHLIGPNMRVESSKDSVTVNTRSMQLVEMFLDPVKWANLFPTIISKAETINVFDSGLPVNRNGALLLMCEEMHILSPLVQSRKFHFLRYCEHVEAGLWIITDVSVNPPGQHNPFSRSWKHPSGFMIQEMPDGSCRVVCVEHVEVDEIRTHQLFKDLVETKTAYGAERWLKELRRMCERFTCFFDEKIPDPRGGYHVINSVERKRSVMKLSYRMVKMFCESLSMSGHDLNFPHPIMDNTSGVKISVRKNIEMGHPNGAVVVAATTLWFPLHYQIVFEFLTDTTKRPQWDAFAANIPEHEIAHISVGANPGNYISLILPFMPNTESNEVTLQECFMDPIGSYVVYAPIDATVMDKAIGGDDTSIIPILPSGFVISADGLTNAESSGGSLLTVAFQMLVPCSLTPDGTQIQDVESVEVVKTLLDSTVQKIQNALICY